MGIIIIDTNIMILEKTVYMTVFSLGFCIETVFIFTGVCMIILEWKK